MFQKGVLLVRILTIADRISICFFEPGDLRFRQDSGQMEEDLDALLLVLSSQIMFVQEDLQQAQGQSKEDLIYLLLWLKNCKNNLIIKLKKEDLLWRWRSYLKWMTSIFLSDFVFVLIFISFALWHHALWIFS